MSHLRETGKLPGPQGAPTSTSLSHFEVELPPEFPATRNVSMFFNRDKETVYSYELRKESPASEWVLLSVRRINNQTGAVVEELPLSKADVTTKAGRGDSDGQN